MHALKRLRRTACLLLTLFATGTACAADAPLPWSGARQMVVVVSDGWDAGYATLQTFARRGDGRWRAHSKTVPVVLGRSGSAWGLGLHPEQTDGPQKREGDGRSPAGVFDIGEAFGYAASARTALPYQAMHASSYCMDVVASPLYNRIVDAREVGEAAVAGSTEPMRLDLRKPGDLRYRNGFVIAHNQGNVPGMGSCIFAHLQAPDSAPTAGCTAMADAEMQRLLKWLRPRKRPVFVLLPKAEYARLANDWKLPGITELERAP